MRRISQIGWIVLAASTAFAFAATPSSAEARGFRLRLGIGSASAAAPVPPRATERIASAGVPLPVAPPRATEPASPRTEPWTQARETVRGLTPVAVAPVAVAPIAERAKPSPHPVRVAGPWCPSDRIVGAGVGFCEVN